METKNKFNASLLLNDSNYYYNNNINNDNTYIRKYHFNNRGSDGLENFNENSKVSKLQPNIIKKFNICLVDDDNNNPEKSIKIKDSYVKTNFDEELNFNNKSYISNNNNTLTQLQKHIFDENEFNNYNWNNSNNNNNHEYYLSSNSESSIEIPQNNYRISFKNSFSSAKSINYKSDSQAINKKSENIKSIKIVDKNDLLKFPNNYDYLSNNSQSSKNSESSISECLSESDSYNFNYEDSISFSTESGSLSSLEKRLNFKFPHFKRFEELKLKYKIDSKSDKFEGEKCFSDSIKANSINTNNNSFKYNNYDYYSNINYYSDKYVYTYDENSNNSSSKTSHIKNKDIKGDNKIDEKNNLFSSLGNQINDDNYYTKSNNQLLNISYSHYNNKSNNIHYDSESEHEDTIYYQQNGIKKLSSNKKYTNCKIKDKSKNKVHSKSKVSSKHNKKKKKICKSSKIDNSNEKHKSMGSTLPLLINKESNNNNEYKYKCKKSEDNQDLIKKAKFKDRSSNSSSSLLHCNNLLNVKTIKEKQSLPFQEPYSHSNLNTSECNNKNIINHKNGYCIINNNNEFIINKENKKSRNKKKIDKNLIKHVKKYKKYIKMKNNNYDNNNNNDEKNNNIFLIVVNDKIYNTNTNYLSSSSSSNEKYYFKRKNKIKKGNYQNDDGNIKYNINNNEKPKSNLTISKKDDIYDPKLNIDTLNNENQCDYKEILEKNTESVNSKVSETNSLFIDDSVSISSVINISNDNHKISLIDEVQEDTVISNKKSNNELDFPIVYEENIAGVISSKNKDKCVEINPIGTQVISKDILKYQNFIDDQKSHLLTTENENLNQNLILNIKNVKSYNNVNSTEDKNPELLLHNSVKEKVPLLQLKHVDSGIISISSFTEFIKNENSELLTDEIISESDSINLSKSIVSDNEIDLIKEVQRPDTKYYNCSTKEPLSFESTDNTKVNSSSDIYFYNNETPNKLSTINEIITESPPETIIENYQLSTSISQKLPSKENIKNTINMIDNSSPNNIVTDNKTINSTEDYNESINTVSKDSLDCIFSNYADNLIKINNGFITPPPSPFHEERNGKNENLNNRAGFSSEMPLLFESNTPKENNNKIMQVRSGLNLNDYEVDIPHATQFQFKSPFIDNKRTSTSLRINDFPYINKKASLGQEIYRNYKRKIDVSQFLLGIRNRQENIKAKENEFLRVIDEETKRNEEQKILIKKTSDELNAKMNEIRQLMHKVSNHKRILMKQKEENNHLQEELEEEKKQAKTLQQQLNSQCEINIKQEKEISYYKEIHNIYLEENQRLQALLLKLTNSKSITSPYIPSFSLPPPSSPTPSIDFSQKDLILSPASSSNTLI
ncbi:hypothetical protein BCR36DRAFT_6178 [Piromyces finnis]|uniref:Uncharacterized protein n=1 Tax=Piromyces finnis TaxID=1754191 RepID=A0A1Y1VQB2_9FUNG|nr:hypothetical protein BCR36DRAFT_6178 [Piromyces finnis]|eukprot:ORX61061.1 hypothetical protein BCR36DRAFT_6178 [Piromyces finnis]